VTLRGIERHSDRLKRETLAVLVPSCLNVQLGELGRLEKSDVLARKTTLERTTEELVEGYGQQLSVSWTI
jgi:hypothetical protein